MFSLFKNKNILVIGGAGSIGSELVKQLLSYNPKAIRVLDNNETGLFDLQNKLNDSRLRFLVGDIRDLSRLEVSIEDIDYVFHAAAFKHVHYSEYNPFEAVKTNIIGTQNVISAALSRGVKKVISISTDKAVNSVSTMGATKLLTEKLITAANYYKGGKKTVFSSVRFGNVIGSRGSVIPLFKKQIKKGGPVTITSKEMTRFMMSIEQAVKLVLKAAKHAKGGEIFVLKMPTIRIIDLAEVLVEKYTHLQDIKIDVIGKRPGEKYHEELITEEEKTHTLEVEDMLIILPTIFNEQGLKNLGHKIKSNFCNVDESVYLSSKAKFLDKEKIKDLLNKKL